MIDLVVNRVKNGENKELKYFVIFGGNQSGKSEAGGIIASRVFTEKKNSRILCATIESRISVQVQGRKLYQYLPQKAIEYGTYDSTKKGWRNNIIKGKNGSELLMKTYEQGADAFQGDQFNLIWLDEECDWSIFSECIPRTLVRDGVILLTFTSLNGFTKLVNFLWESDRKDVYSIVLDMLSNPYVADSSKQAVASSIDPDEYQSRVLGKPYLKAGLIYKEYGAIHKIERFDYIKTYKSNPTRYIITEGIDPHTRTPHRWIRFLYDKQDDILYIVEAIKAPRESMLVQDFARIIKEARCGLDPEYCQIDTSSEAPILAMIKTSDDEQLDHETIRSEFARAGIHTILCIKDNQIGINAVKTRLKSVKTATGIVLRPPRLYVFEDLQIVHWEFSRYSWDEYASSASKDNKELLNRVNKKDDHFMDIIKYECIKLQPKETKNDQEVYAPRYTAIGY